MTDIDHIVSMRRLVIRVSRHSLSFSTTEGHEVVYEPYPLKNSISIAANMREAMRHVSLLQQTYGSVLVMVDSPVLMVPSDLFDEEEKATCYRHAFTQQEQMLVMHTVLPDLSSVAVFSVPKDFRLVIADAFSNVHFVAALAPLWRHLNQRSYTGPHHKLYAYFHEQYVDLYCFAQNRFKFCNSFPCSNKEDAIYYILAVWKQTGLAAEHDELFLTGNLPECNELKADLETYVKRVFIINPAGEFNRVGVAQIEGVPYDLVTLYVKGL